MQFTITDLVIYPVKSLGGIHVASSKAETEGLQYDRRWMLVDEQHRFMTQRELAELCLFKLEFTNDGFLVTHSVSGSTFMILFDAYTDEEITVTIWDDVVKANIVSADANAWFSALLKQPCKLVKVTPGTQRKVDPRYALNNETTGFSDAFPVLIIGENSLKDLNSRLENPVPMNRFRPNIVFSGGHAFAEDSWSVIEAGSVKMQVAKPCARCVVTTIDQQTAVSGKEPLKTLSAYRSLDHKVLFGQNTVILQEGEIKIGDIIRI